MPPSHSPQRRPAEYAENGFQQQLDALQGSVLEYQKLVQQFINSLLPGAEAEPVILPFPADRVSEPAEYDDKTRECMRMIAEYKRLRGTDIHAANQVITPLLHEAANLLIGVLRHRRFPENDLHQMINDVLIQGLEKIDQLREPATFFSWLRTICIRMSINFVTRIHDTERHMSAFEKQCDLESGTPGTLDTLITRENQALVRGAIEKLNDMDRETIQGFYFHHLSILQMAEILDVPVGTIKRRLHVARHRLKVLLQESDVLVHEEETAV